MHETPRATRSTNEIINISWFCSFSLWSVPLQAFGDNSETVSEPPSGLYLTDTCPVLLLSAEMMQQLGNPPWSPAGGALPGCSRCCSYQYPFHMELCCLFISVCHWSLYPLAQVCASFVYWVWDVSAYVLLLVPGRFLRKCVMQVTKWRQGCHKGKQVTSLPLRTSPPSGGDKNVERAQSRC